MNKKTTREFLSSKHLQLTARLLLGGIFVYAGISKVLDPLALAKMIAGFKIFPPWTASIGANVLPWLEIITGLALISGILKKTCAAVLTGLLIVFIAVITVALLKGTFTGCGCFASSTGKATVTDGLWIIFRDLLFMIPGGIILVYSNDSPATVSA